MEKRGWGWRGWGRGVKNPTAHFLAVNAKRVIMVLRKVLVRAHQAGLRKMKEAASP